MIIKYLFYSNSIVGKACGMRDEGQLDYMNSDGFKATIYTMAHYGGTDKDGCHVDSRTGLKHCH